MTDIVFIRGLRLITVIGVYDWEREIQQELVLDIDLAWSIREPAATDDVHKALDYAAVTERLERFAQESDYQLVESFAEEAASVLMQDFSVPWLKLRVAKPGAVKQADTVGVEIERGSRPL